MYSAAAPRAYEPAVIARSSCHSIHSPSHTEVARSQKLDRCRKSLNAREALMQLVQLDTLRFKDLESGIPITWAALSRSTRRSTICCEKRAFRRSGIKRPAKVSTTRGALSAAVTSRRWLLRTRLAVGGRPVFRGRSPEGPSRHPLSIYYLYLSMWCEDRDAVGSRQGLGEPSVGASRAGKTQHAKRVAALGEVHCSRTGIIRPNQMPTSSIITVR